MLEGVTEDYSLRRLTMTSPRAPLRKNSGKSGRRLLLVEDDEFVAAGLISLLELEGFVVHTVAHGLAVVDTIRSFDPEVVILDLTLPDVDGVEVFRRLRKRWPELPVIFSTGHGSNVIAELKAKRVDILWKPYEIGELLSALQRVTGA